MGLFDKFKKRNFEDDYEEDDFEEERKADFALDGENLELKVIKPTSIENTLSVVDNLKLGRTVLLNLEGIDAALCRRMIDIVSGASYALNGKIKKATNDSYFIAPYGVDVNGVVFNNSDDKDDDDEIFSDI